MAQVKHRIVIEAFPSHTLARYGGEVIAESNRALVMREDGYPPRIYFPQSDVNMSMSEQTEHKTHCPFKGDAAYWTFSAGGETLRNVAWGYPDPMPDVSLIAGHIAFADPVEIES